jgi:4a-hydroxytetrahydrobiopterin dehydratase
MKELKERKCKPCEDGADPLNDNQISEYQKELNEDWKIIDNKKISREFPFDSFGQGMEFANKVAEIAEKENHHPDVCIFFRKVRVDFSTHKIGGLSDNDFIMAAKVDEL